MFDVILGNPPFGKNSNLVKTAAEADVCIGRVGAGPGGRVYTKDYDHRSPSSHYFIRTKSSATRDRLLDIEPLLIQCARSGNAGCPSLSLDDLVKIYLNREQNSNGL
jgi:hypothetical protein